MAESASDARIRDLKRRLELDPTSRLFVSLAEEYRKAGRTADALITLQQGLRNHPGYISAQVALGRAYLEAGNISESIATFTKVLTADPGNLVSAKSLADIFLSRGESVEAIKKYKLYRALSGDRSVDDMVVRLEKEIAPPAPRPSKSSGPAPLPAPPTFFEQPTTVATPRSSRAAEVLDSRPGPVRRAEDKYDVTSIKWEESTGGKKQAAAQASDVPTQPFQLDAAQAQPPFVRAEDVPPMPQESAAPFADEPEPPEESRTASSALDEVFAEESVFPLSAEPQPHPAAVPSGGKTDKLEAPGEPHGRALADLYYAQGHYSEALQIYDELVAAHPFDAELKRLRRDAEARLLPAGTGPGSGGTEPGLQRRLARIRALKEWLSVVQAG